MAVGLHPTNYANKVLDHMHRAVASTAPASNNIKLHTGDPGAAATTAPSANTTRAVATFSAASAGAVALSNTPTWSSWAAGAETISHISIWDNISAGVVLATAALTASKAV